MSEFHLKWIWSRFIDFYGVDCISIELGKYFLSDKELVSLARKRKKGICVEILYIQKKKKKFS